MVLLQKLGDQQWILVNVSPSQLWPQLKYFLVKNKISIAEEDGTKGVLRTHWSMSKETEQLERYRFVVEQGLAAEYDRNPCLSKLNRSGEVIGANDNFDGKSNQARRTWMLERLAKFLASGDNAGSVSLLAQGISTESKLSMVKDSNGFPNYCHQITF